MNLLNNGMNKLFDVLLAPVAAWPAVAMLLIAMVTAVWALLLFKAATNQDKLTVTRDRLFGHIYEMGLYQEHLSVVARIQWALAKANLRYLSLTLPALLVLMVPMVLTIAQLDSRYSLRPLAPGEETVFSVTLAEGAAADLSQVRLVAPAGLQVNAGPIRDAATGSVAWRLAVAETEPYDLAVWNGPEELAQYVVPVGGKLPAVGERGRANWLHTLLYPGAPALPGSGEVSAMSINLPARSTRYLGVTLDWMVAFMIFSLLVGLAIKDVLRVSI
ncbi:MAG: hypothetical protein QNL91_01455 [Candidatus Krumholzibacteria bacterium]|nr:hypothetical protein [Candidatus Krumholzibacteria bacterium]